MKIPEYILATITGSTENYEKGFINGWNACDQVSRAQLALMHDQVESAHEELESLSDACLEREGDLRKENAELEEQIEIAKNALKKIEDKCYGDGYGYGDGDGDGYGNGW